LIDTLDKWDYLVWWMCQWDREHPPGPRSLASGMRLWLFWVPLLVLGPMLLLSLLGDTLTGHDRDLRTLSGLAGIVLFVLWVLAVPRTGSALVWRRLARDQHLSRMQEKAQDGQLSGIINRERIHWFLLFPDCFQEATELRRTSAAGVEDYQFRVATVPWGLVRDVVVHEQHVFLVGPGEDVWIIPKRCFADVATLAEFLDTIHSCRRAASRAPVGDIVPVGENAEAIRAAEPAR
jgi:hypothetical protein